MDRKSKLLAARNLAVEFVIYGTLVTLYALTVLQFLADPLANLYHDNLTIYAFVALLLIVGQGVALEEVTSLLLARLRLSRFD